ncbi:MAG: hypothetical protein P4N59_03790 [Negativicutes bacterium]|nr:hypothetical protein [Negativicutes bacterium]
MQFSEKKQALVEEIHDLTLQYQQLRELGQHSSQDGILLLARLESRLYDLIVLRGSVG